MVELKPLGANGLDGLKNSESPDSLRSKTVGIVIPPAGPNVADFKPESMWGVEVECFSARRWRMGGTEGEGGTSNVERFIRSEVFVLRLSRLGFRFMPGIVGLMKDGEAGSETREEASELKGG